eukprot:gene6615-4735_t
MDLSLCIHVFNLSNECGGMLSLSDDRSITHQSAQNYMNT